VPHLDTCPLLGYIGDGGAMAHVDLADYTGGNDAVSDVFPGRNKPSVLDLSFYRV